MRKNCKRRSTVLRPSAKQGTTGDAIRTSCEKVNVLSVTAFVRKSAAMFNVSDPHDVKAQKTMSGNAIRQSCRSAESWRNSAKRSGNSGANAAKNATIQKIGKNEMMGKT